MVESLQRLCYMGLVHFGPTEKFQEKDQVRLGAVCCPDQSVPLGEGEKSWNVLGTPRWVGETALPKPPPLVSHWQ